MKLSRDVTLTPAELAEAFCELNDEKQADFFIEAAKIAAGWNDSGMQWHFIGKHLRTCACSTYEARDMVVSIAAAIEASQ